MNDSDGIDKRRHERSELSYVIEFKILSQNIEHYTFRGYIENVSESGAGIVFEDRYGRANVYTIKGSKIKLSFSLPSGEKITLISTVRWFRGDEPQPFFIRVGIKFENIEQWQLDAVKKLIWVSNKDHNMMWTLWEQYEKNLL